MFCNVYFFSFFVFFFFFFFFFLYISNCIPNSHNNFFFLSFFFFLCVKSIHHSAYSFFIFIFALIIYLLIILFYFIDSGEISVYLMKIKVVQSIVNWYRIISLVTDTIYIFTPRFGRLRFSSLFQKCMLPPLQCSVDKYLLDFTFPTTLFFWRAP